MINLCLYLLLLALLLYTAVLYANTALALLSFCGMFLLGAAFLYLSAAFFTLHFSVSVPISIAEQEDMINMELKVTNKSPLPSAKLLLFLRYENTTTGERGCIRLKGAADSGGTAVIRTPLKTTHCGKYRIWLQKIRIYDLTGIFYLPKRSRLRTEFYIMPKLYDTSVTVTPQSRHFIGESEQYENTPGGSDPSEILQIRPFRDGDRIQSIHWKMSAKTDELMVRENRRPLGCPVVLFLEPKASAKTMDAFLSLASAISFALIGQKCAHYAVWYDNSTNDIIRVRIEDEESFYLFLMMFCDGKKLSPTPDILEQYLEKYRTEPFVTGIFLRSDLTVEIGSAYKKAFTSTKLKQELSGVEFVV